MGDHSQSTPNCSDYYTDSKFVNVAITAAASASISLLACLSAIFIIVLFKKWQSFGQRLIAYLIISATLFSMATALRRVHFDEHFTSAERGYCAFAGYFTQITVWFLIDSIVAITLYLFLAVVWNRFTEKYEYLYVVFIFGFPFIFGWIPFIHHTFGRAGAWCWIRLIDFATCERIVFGQVLQLVMFYVPLLVILPSIIAVYLIMVCKLRRDRKFWKGIIDDTSEHANKMMKSETLHLLAYPLIFFALTLPILVTRTQIWINPQHPVLPLWYTSVILVGLLGTAISLAFILDKDTRRQLKWSHIRAAFKNYSATKGVSEYKTGEAEGEREMSGKHRVPYNRLTDDCSLNV